MASVSAPTEEFEGAIGIDLGTTYSCVGVWRNGKVEIVPNEGGNRTTPSFVAFTKSEKLWGDAAKNQLAMNAANTVYDAKRLIGRSFSDSEVQKDSKIWPFQIKAGEHDKPLICVDYKGEKQEYHPEQISSILLAGLKGTAEKFLGKKVSKAVITVPAYFNDAQRTTTKMAGQLAGLNVLRIINEPTAAALAYGLEGGTTSEDAQGRTVLVFDLGGGTFDVSLIRLEGPVFEVKATAGNTHLGGQDFDNSMVEFCLKEIQRMAGVDASSNQKVVRKLRTACEKAKRILSSATEDVIEIDVEGNELSIKITRAKFEQINRALFDTCMKDVKRVLEDAKCAPSQVDDVVMVGGSSRIPKIQSMVSDFFGKPLKHSINPDEAVAHGAAIQGHVLAGNKAKEGDVGDVLLLDVVPLSIGVDVDGGVLDILIKRNTTIPRKVEKTYTTADDELTEVTVDVYEGERKQAKLNNHLGSFELKEITPGIPSIKVTFEVDANGVLNVSALEVGGTAKGSIKITNTNRLSKTDIDRMLADAVRFQKEDAEFAKVQHMRAVLEPFAYSMLDCVENEDNAVEAWIVEEVKGHVTWVEEHLMDAPLEELKEHYTDLKNLHAQIEETWMDAEEEEAQKKKKDKAKAAGKKGKRKRSDDSDSDEDWGGKAGAADSSSSEDEESGADSDEEGGKKKKKEKKEKKEKKQKTDKPAPKAATTKPAAKKPKKEAPAAASTAASSDKKDEGEASGAAPMEVDGEDKPAPAKAAPKAKPEKAAKPDAAESSTNATTDAAASTSEGKADAKPKKEKAPPKPKAEKADKPEKEKKPKEPKEPKAPKEPKEPKEKKEKAPPKEKKEKPEKKDKKEGEGAAAASGAAASPKKSVAPLGAPRRRAGLAGLKKTEKAE